MVVAGEVAVTVSDVRLGAGDGTRDWALHAVSKVVATLRDIALLVAVSINVAVKLADLAVVVIEVALWVLAFYIADSVS